MEIWRLRLWGHGADLLGSRDVTGHVTTGLVVGVPIGDQ